MHIQRRFLAQVSAWLSPNAESDSAIRTFGASEEQIVRSVFPFDLDEGSANRRLGARSTSSIVFYGSARSEKGVGLLPDLLKTTRGVHYEFYFPRAHSRLVRALKAVAGTNRIAVHVGEPWRPTVRRAALNGRATLLPSIYPSCGEIAFYNAMALGKAIAAFKVGANEFLVGDGNDGCLVSPGNIAGLADALIRLHQDADLASRLGERNRARAHELFAPHALWTTYHKAYDRALTIGSAKWH